MKYNYTCNQIIDYDEYCAVEHILERHSKDFNKEIDIYKLFVNIKEFLNEKNKIKKLVFNDLYLVKIENIGINAENYLFVVTLPNSKDIITMYPLNDEKSIDKYVKENENTEQKKLIKTQ